MTDTEQHLVVMDRIQDQYEALIDEYVGELDWRILALGLTGAETKDQVYTALPESLKRGLVVNAFLASYARLVRKHDL